MQDRDRGALESLSLPLADENGDAPRSGLPLLPWSLVGLGLLISWFCCTHLPSLFVGPAHDPGLGNVASFSMRAGDIGTLLFVAIFADRLGPLSSHRRVCAAMAAVGSLGTLAAPFVAGLGSGTWTTALLSLVCVVAGMGGAVLFLLWAEVYSRLGPTRCIVYGSVSGLVAGGSSLVIYLTGDASICFIALLPLVSGIAAGVSLGRMRAAAATEGCPASALDKRLRLRYPVPVKLVALMALAGFVSGFAGALLVQVDGLGSFHRILVTVLFAALLLTAFFLRNGELDIRVLAWVTLPIAVVSFALIPLLWSSAGAVLSFLVKFTYVSFALFVLLILTNVCYRYSIPSARVFASARAASEAAILAGILLRMWMRESGLLDNDGMLLAISVVGLVMIVGCVVLWHSERSVTSDWGTAGVDPASGMRVVTERERVLGQVEGVAEEYGLTPREREILELLMSDRDATAIEQELFVSHNTLKTHLRHIYAKLGVHTRVEAVALIRGRAV